MHTKNAKGYGWESPIILTDNEDDSNEGGQEE